MNSINYGALTDERKATAQCVETAIVNIAVPSVAQCFHGPSVHSRAGRGSLRLRGQTEVI